ncbi:hypothetical protein [Rhizobium sp. BK491]|uniref:hypothetical protein n=1 Tax=Rhizobium sp. BK491 TaxID=2587009 RepID=UPI0016072155|nr:hypothetical protein [Rhizobium sp. BK491]MBB3571117.1 hypothetical protein [Rhizobium sp. BK491]
MNDKPVLLDKRKRWKAKVLLDFKKRLAIRSGEDANAETGNRTQASKHCPAIGLVHGGLATVTIV